MIGVWDTVGALGLPTPLNRINPMSTDHHQVGATPEVEHAFHAVAIDEQRKAFRPVLWDEPGEGETQIEQVWFAGCHSDIGGFYRDHRLADIPLVWMIDRAQSIGLRFDEEKVQALKPQYDAPIHNSRRGLGTLYPKALRTIEASKRTLLANTAAARVKNSGSAPPYKPTNLVGAHHIDETYTTVNVKGTHINP